MTAVTRAADAEWMKFRTLVSHPVTAASAFLLVVGLAAMLLVARAGQGALPATTELLTGVSWAQFLLAVLAVVTICSEWTSGTSRVTFLAVPTRWPVLAGKAAVMGGVGLVAGTAGAAGALALGATAGLDVGGEPALALRLVAGTGLYLGTVAVLALGIGTIVRHLAGSVLTVLGFLGAAPFVLGLVPVPELQRLALYLPTSAGTLLIAPESSAVGLTPWGGYAVLLAWTVAALAGAVRALHAQDV